MDGRTDGRTDGRDILRFLTYQSTQPHVAPPALRSEICAVHVVSPALKLEICTVIILHGPS